VVGLTTESAAMTGELFRVVLPSGVELRYLQGGAGELLIFIHGVMGDWASWPPQWPAFCARYRCTTYSRRYIHPNHNDMASPDLRRWSRPQPC
jgi:pimeloyl-ACP methyl ester carboxylesterase